MSYAYNDAGLRKNLTVTGQNTVFYGYDNAGRPTNVVQGAFTTSLTHDDSGRNQLTTTTGVALTKSRQFTAREDDGTGLYYYRARYYHPALGRFVSEDPIGFVGGINLYAYVANVPLRWVDPFGYGPKDDATFQCDGEGNYEVVLNWAKDTVVESCIRQHEEDHIKDWKKFFGPDSCKDKPKGYVPKGGKGYLEFLNASECNAFKNEKICEEDLLKKCKQGDKAFTEKVLKDTVKRITEWCGKAGAGGK